MKRLIAIAAVAFQVVALGYIAAEREWILRTGRTVWLRTAPIDPRDVMRGDYVKLEYEIGRVRRSLWRDGLTNVTPLATGRSPATRVFATLRVDADGPAEVIALSDRQPTEGLFLRGRLEPAMSWGQIKAVRYGLEAFFMEQGKARELEDERSQSRRGVPLRMEVALGKNGIGVLKGYRWEALGIVVDFETLQRTNQLTGFPQVQTVILGAKVELKNHSTEPVAIVDLPDHGSFGLVCDARWQVPAYNWVGESKPLAEPEAEHIVVLQPGQIHRAQLNLTQPEWFVVDIRTNVANAVGKPLQNLPPDWGNGFRIEYRSPSREACAKLPNAKAIWHGRLRSRWFNPMGNVD